MDFTLKENNSRIKNNLKNQTKNRKSVVQKEKRDMKIGVEENLYKKS